MHESATNLMTKRKNSLIKPSISGYKHQMGVEVKHRKPLRRYCNQEKCKVDYGVQIYVDHNLKNKEIISNWKYKILHKEETHHTKVQMGRPY